MASERVCSTHVVETACVGHGLDKVWDCIRGMDFTFLSNVTAHTVEEGKSGSEVGSIHQLTYKDKTVQRLMLLSLSDLKHKLAYEMIESQPAVGHMSALYTLKVTEVTNCLCAASGCECQAAFIEWTTDFSSDAKQETVQDSRFKKIEGFKDLDSYLSEKK
eukprot:40118_1